MPSSDVLKNWNLVDIPHAIFLYSGEAKAAKFVNLTLYRSVVTGDQAVADQHCLGMNVCALGDGGESSRLAIMLLGRINKRMFTDGDNANQGKSIAYNTVQSLRFFHVAVHIAQIC
jgi:hypothetical protein